VPNSLLLLENHSVLLTRNSLTVELNHLPGSFTVVADLPGLVMDLFYQGGFSGSLVHLAICGSLKDLFRLSVRLS